MFKRRALALLMLATTLAGGALAQEPSTPDGPDLLCDGLAGVIAAADEKIPFIILVPSGQSLGSLPRLNRNPRGFDGFSSCQLYRAGNATQGTVGGGPHNYLRCIAFSQMTTQNKPEEEPVAKAAASEAYETLAARTRACLEPAGWAASGGERTRKYEDYETALTFTREGTANDVVVRLEEDNSSPRSRSKSTFWQVDLTVRNPNPAHPKQ